MKIGKENEQIIIVKNPYQPFLEDSQEEMPHALPKRTVNDIMRDINHFKKAADDPDLKVRSADFNQEIRLLEKELFNSYHLPPENAPIKVWFWDVLLSHPFKDPEIDFIPEQMDGANTIDRKEGHSIPRTGIIVYSYKTVDNNLIPEICLERMNDGRIEMERYFMNTQIQDIRTDILKCRSLDFGETFYLKFDPCLLTHDEQGFRLTRVQPVAHSQNSL